MNKVGRVRDPGAAAHLLQLVASRETVARSDLVRLSGLAASTVSARVEELIAAGFLRELGDGTSRGGRRPRLLDIRPDGGMVLVASLGARHARMAVLDLSARIITVVEEPVRLADGPDVVLPWLSRRLEELVGCVGETGGPVRGVGVGLPGPVEVATGRVISPSRMPGWHNTEVKHWLSSRFSVPAVVENDANLLAVGEHRITFPELDHVVVVKAGTGIGCGVISAGALHRGGHGAAGDISHVRVDAAHDKPCGCGNTGCLETVASGAAIAESLTDQGTPVGDLAEIVRLVEDADPLATTLVRSAGAHLGEVLAVVVNFFNPQAVVVGGALGAAEPLIAAVRGVLYTRCLPLASQTLEITGARDGMDASVVGAAHLVLEEMLAHPPVI